MKRLQVQDMFYKSDNNKVTLKETMLSTVYQAVQREQKRDTNNT